MNINFELPASKSAEAIAAGLDTYQDFVETHGALCADAARWDAAREYDRVDYIAELVRFLNVMPKAYQRKDAEVSGVASNFHPAEPAEKVRYAGSGPAPRDPAPDGERASDRVRRHVGESFDALMTALSKRGADGYLSAIVATREAIVGAVGCELDAQEQVFAVRIEAAERRAEKLTKSLAKAAAMAAIAHVQKHQ